MNSFREKLDAWAATLTDPERAILRLVALRAFPEGEGPEVAGFGQPYIELRDFSFGVSMPVRPPRRVGVVPRASSASPPSGRAASTPSLEAGSSAAKELAPRCSGNSTAAYSRDFACAAHVVSPIDPPTRGFSCLARQDFPLSENVR